MYFALFTCLFLFYSLFQKISPQSFMFTEPLPHNLQQYLYLFVLITGSSLLTGPEGLSMTERENLKKLKALRRYRRRYGVEALLHRQLRERRQAVTEGAPQV